MEKERRVESRMLCADVVEVRWTDGANRPRRATALLEDISAHGACLQFEIELPAGTGVEMEHPKMHVHGTVRYCVYREIGYFTGVEFEAGHEWSRNEFTPDHLLDLQEMVERKAKKASGRGH